MAALRPNIPFAQYCRIAAVNWSSLKHLDQSPKHYRWHQDNPDDHDTPSRRLGRATHTLALDPESFERTYAVYDGARRGTNDYKAFEAANAGRDILKATELDEARAIATAVQTHPVLAPYRVGARYEMTATWTDATTGLRCKARPDWLPGSGDVLIDLKTSTTINELRFRSQAEKLGYFGQLAHYAAGLEACGHPVKRVLLAVVESKPPYDVAVFEVTPDSLSSAAQEVAELLGRLKACLYSNRWPGRYESEQPLERPDWATGAEFSLTFDEE